MGGSKRKSILCTYICHKISSALYGKYSTMVSTIILISVCNQYSKQQPLILLPAYMDHWHCLKWLYKSKHKTPLLTKAYPVCCAKSSWFVIIAFTTTSMYRLTILQHNSHAPLTFEPWSRCSIDKVLVHCVMQAHQSCLFFCGIYVAISFLWLKPHIATY